MMEYNKKPEKLSSAIYLITSFFSDQEPLKWTLRTLASDFVSLSVSFNTNSFKEREVTTGEIRNLILKLEKLFVVAKNAGMISPENYELIHDELNKYMANIGQSINISDLLRIEAPQSQPNVVKEVEKREPEVIKDRIEYKTPEDRSLKGFGAVSVKKNSRQSTIIGLLKRKKEIMIKDVSPLINGCSEKTIQRELSAMVQKGVLRRVGEKRWSRYSLA